MTETYITTSIKKREVVYYLTSEADLNDIKTKSIFGDISILLFSLALGGVISVVITKATTQITPEMGRILAVLNIVLYICTCIFAGFSAYYYIASFRAIQRIKGSGEIKSFATSETKDQMGLQILEARFWTTTGSLDMANQLGKLVIGDKLNTRLTIEIAGDPHPGVAKKLTLKYRYNRVEFTREYNEGDTLLIP